MGAQQYRNPGSVGPTAYLKSAVTAHHPSDLSLAQKSSAASSQQDVLASVFGTGRKTDFFFLLFFLGPISLTKLKLKNQKKKKLRDGNVYIFFLTCLF